MRLRAALWLIVAVAVIMASLVLIAGLSKTFALIGLTSFVVSVVLLPRPDEEQALAAAGDLTSLRQNSAMYVMAEALPDPAILLDRPAGCCSAMPRRVAYSPLCAREATSPR